MQVRIAPGIPTNNNTKLLTLKCNRRDCFGRIKITGLIKNVIIGQQRFMLRKHQATGMKQQSRVVETASGSAAGAHWRAD